MKVAVLQHDIVWEDRDANFARLAPQIEAAAAAGARLAVVTETFSTGFGRGDRIAEPECGPSSTFLREQATRHGLWVCGSCPEVPPDSPGGRPFNTLVLAGPGGRGTTVRGTTSSTTVSSTDRPAADLDDDTPDGTPDGTPNGTPGKEETHG